MYFLRVKIPQRYGILYVFIDAGYNFIVHSTYQSRREPLKPKLKYISYVPTTTYIGTWLGTILVYQIHVNRYIHTNVYTKGETGPTTYM